MAISIVVPTSLFPSFTGEPRKKDKFDTTIVAFIALRCRINFPGSQFRCETRNVSRTSRRVSIVDGMALSCAHAARLACERRILPMVRRWKSHPRKTLTWSGGTEGLRYLADIWEARVSENEDERSGEY